MHPHHAPGVGQFRSPVGAFEFMSHFYAAPLSYPKPVISAAPFEAVQSWDSVQTPMVPVSLEGPPASSSGIVNYSPLAPFVTTGYQMMEERQAFIREMNDPRRVYNRRKQIMYDGIKVMRKKQDDRFQYVAPGSAEAKFIEYMIQSQADPTTGLIPTAISLEQDRM